MSLSKTLAYLGVIATIFGATYMHDRANRYDVVAAGAGGGASQDQPGETEAPAFLVDHATGKVWFIAETNLTAYPVTRVTCQDIGQEELDSGCKYKGKESLPDGLKKNDVE
jgi:hypothetical protein